MLSSIRLFTALVLVTVSSLAFAQDESYKPDVAKATEEPLKALKSLKVLPGFKVDLFAAEPLLANPVAFSIDEKGRFYVIETYRHSDGVTDTRSHMNWLDDDLKSRTVADRVAMYKKFFTPQEFAKYSKEHDRIKILEDTDGDGKADKATIFADGFNLPESGIGAGILARKGDVYFTCIPDLWLLKDTNGDGKADVRKSLHTGYGVHVGFLGHDLHGLIFGPDGKLYFSIGDRGFNVKTIDGKELAVLDSGSVLRCDPDGKNLEVVATGLRNPQELAFTEYGDLFTVDNNSDGGDKARLVQILEGSDNGWRIGYQFIEQPNSRGIWNSEKMWYPAWDGQAAYIVPPLANFTDGPSGLTYYPGTGLNASQKGRFYISDFRGAANASGIRSFKLQPKGASFDLTQPEQFLWGFEVTDCDFGPDGALYATDWVQGWNKTGKGRIWKVTDASGKRDPAMIETQTLIAEGCEGLAVKDLASHLKHADYRVRLEAQFALAEKAKDNKNQDHDSALAALRSAALTGTSLEERLHGLWGAAQVFRSISNNRAMSTNRSGQYFVMPLRPLFSDSNAEIRAQAAKAFGLNYIVSIPELTTLLTDPSPRVRLFALQGASSHANPAAVAPVMSLLRTVDGRDPTLRHAAVMVLTSILKNSPDGEAAITRFAGDLSPNVRMAVLLAKRRALKPDVSDFLNDVDQPIVLEAARAIAELPELSSELPKLAAMASKPVASESLARRIVAACEGTGDAKGLVLIASRKDLPEGVRVEALNLLGKWEKPSNRHPITGLWRDAKPRPKTEAADALSASLPKVLADSPNRVRIAAARIAGDLGLKDAGPSLRTLVADTTKPEESRVEAIKALAALKDEKLDEVAHAAIKDASPAVRVEAVRIVGNSKPEEAIDLIHTALDKGPIVEKQGSFATLGAMKSSKADDLLKTWLDKLIANDVASEIRLDLIDAASKKSSDDIKGKLAKYESTASKTDPLSSFRDSLLGGNAANGRRIFREKAEVQCLRCHKVEGDGGEVGPDLTGMIAKKDRAYILESIVLPNKQIAQGFETTLVAKTDGTVVSGIVKADDAKEIRLMTAEGKLIVIPKTEIDERSRGATAMPEDTIKNLSKGEIRDLVEFLATTKAIGSR
jgi:quinoprotein glucose dehydrogenase